MLGRHPNSLLSDNIPPLTGWMPGISLILGNWPNQLLLGGVVPTHWRILDSTCMVVGAAGLHEGDGKENAG